MFSPRNKSPRDNPRLVWVVCLAAILALGLGYFIHFYLTPGQIPATSPDGRYTVFMETESPMERRSGLPHTINPITLRDNTTHTPIAIQQFERDDAEHDTIDVIPAQIGPPIDIWWGQDSRSFAFREGVAPYTTAAAKKRKYYVTYYQIQGPASVIEYPWEDSLKPTPKWVISLLWEESHHGTLEQRAFALGSLMDDGDIPIPRSARK